MEPDNSSGINKNLIILHFTVFIWGFTGILGALIITGIVLIFKFETRYTTGIIAGLTSALFASLFAIINSRQVKKLEAPVIAFYELAGAFLWITIYLLFTHGFNRAMLLKNADI